MSDKQSIIDYMIRKKNLTGIENAEKDTELLYEMAKQEILNTLFPFDDSIKEIPDRYSLKIILVMEEMMIRGNMGNPISYSENRLSISWKSGELQSLKNIVPNAGGD